MAQIRRSAEVAGLAFQASEVTDGSEGAFSLDPTLAAAKTGTLTTRTDNDTGTLTMADGHGITTGAKLDVYWDGGARYNMTVGTVATNSVPIDGGSGDNLPASSTAITAMVPTSLALAFNGEDATTLAMQCKKARCVVSVFEDTTLSKAFVLDSGQLVVWTSSDPLTNPLDGLDAITTIHFSHEDSDASQEIKFAVEVDLA